MLVVWRGDSTRFCLRSHLMIQRTIYSRLFFGLVACLLCISAKTAPAAEVQKSVLLVYDARSDMLGNIVVDRAIRRVLNEKFTFNLDIRSEYFEGSPPKEDFPILLSWLQRKYSGQTFDIVVPVGSNALRFIRDHGNELFPGAQVVYLGRGTGLDYWRSGAPITGVVAPKMEVQVRDSLAFIHALQPDLERLVVVTGASPVDRNWE